MPESLWLIAAIVLYFAGVCVFLWWIGRHDEVGPHGDFSIRNVGEHDVYVTSGKPEGRRVLKVAPGRVVTGGDGRVHK